MNPGQIEPPVPAEDVAEKTVNGVTFCSQD
jgi:hypothetical protein